MANARTRRLGDGSTGKRQLLQLSGQVLLKGTHAPTSIRKRVKKLRRETGNKHLQVEADDKEFLSLLPLACNWLFIMIETQLVVHYGWASTV